MLLHNVAVATTESVQLSSFVEFSYPRPHQVHCIYCTYIYTCTCIIYNIHVCSVYNVHANMYMYNVPVHVNACIIIVACHLYYVYTCIQRYISVCHVSLCT